MKVLYNYTPSFMGINKETGNSNMQQNEADMNYFMNKTMELISQRAEKEVPENGKFAPIAVSFQIPETNNKAKVIVAYDEINPKDFRRLAVGVQHKNSDRLTMNYILKGTKQEAIDYLNNSDSKNEIRKLIEYLSKKTDDYYSEL